MPLPTGRLTEVQRKFLGDVVKGVSLVEIERGILVSTATVNAEAASSTTEEPIGIPMIWDNTASAFVRYVAQDIAAVITANNSPLPNKAPLLISIGDRRGAGFNTTDVTLSTTPVQLTGLYRDAQVSYAGVDFGTATSGDVTEFKEQMEKQGVVEVATAAAPATSYIS